MCARFIPAAGAVLLSIVTVSAVSAQQSEALNYYAQAASHGQPPVAESPSDVPLPPGDIELGAVADDLTIATDCGCEKTCGCQQACCCCDCKKMKALKAAVAGAHKGVFYDNNFDYLCDECYSDWHLGDRFKRRGIGEHITFDIGGQYRARVMNERNVRSVAPFGVGLTGVDDDFLLHRTRVYLNTEIGRRVRLYAEMVDAESNYENFPPRSIEVNRTDVLNLFGDLMVYENCCGEAWLRAGRQELQYGAQRLISPLDWGNTRRPFEGYKAFWQGQLWDVDAFYTRPIFANPTHFDSPDYDQEFSGAYASYKGRENETIDLYYLIYTNGDDNFQFNTVGGRCQGSRCDWMWEVEGAVQYGDNSDNSDHSAGFWTAGVGRKFECYPWSPSLWVYYDWASGDDDLGAGNGFHHLFPLAHKYLGFMDLYGRRNLETPNVLLTLNPHKKVQLLFWYYYFFLENRNDSPYGVTMAAFNGANAPASADLGHEIDATIVYKFNERMKILFGYSHFFAGDYYALTPGVPYSGDADFLYTEFTVNF